jgi:two-component system OmpR family sensor kinase
LAGVGTIVAVSATTVIMSRRHQAKTSSEVTQTVDTEVLGRRRERFRAVLPFRRWVPKSLRTRVLAWFVGVLAVATAASVLVTWIVLNLQLDQRIDGELVQETGELRRLASGNDPSTGVPFDDDVRRVFEVYLDRNVPSRNEAFITFVNGEPYDRSRQVLPYRLDQDPDLIQRWATLERTDRGRVETPGGPVEYIAVPLLGGREGNGVFVAAIFRGRLDDEVHAAVQAAGAVGLAVLLLGGLLAWRLADRVVAPVTALTQTARAITETDLSRRIQVQGRDEVAQLATTFNAMLDRLERAFGGQRRFVADAGHELRTPLTIVRGHIELLDATPESRRETLELVTDELDRMARIVDDLLVLAKHEQPDFLHLATVDLGQLTDELEQKVQALGDRPWTVEARGRGVIVADRQRLTQAVVQLAENAVRYSPDGEPVALGSNVVDGEARLWVRDRGPGIPADQRERIFERFQRGRGGPRSEGAGLGLTIVRAIVEAHHGRIELESEPGDGSTFTLVVPVDQPGEDDVL